MYVLGVSGSPRRKGNTETLLDKVLQGAEAKGAETFKIILNEINISPCQECNAPDEKGNCIVSDDMDIVYEQVDKADVIVIASPIFFGSLSAQTKIMIDRFQCVWIEKNITKTRKSPVIRKKGAFLCVSSQDKVKYFENAASIVKNFFATIDTNYSRDLYCPGLDSLGDVNKNELFMEKAYDIGMEMLEEE